MRVSEQVMLSALEQGGCIRSFWRRSARLAGTPAPGVPDGLALETPGESGDTPLSHVDFAVVAKRLVCAETCGRLHRVRRRRLASGPGRACDRRAPRSG